MSKAELIEAIASDSNVSKAGVGRVLEALASRVTQSLADGDNDATIPGLGKLSVSTRAARTGRNPRNGAVVQIPAKKAIKFKALKALKDAVQ